MPLKRSDSHKIFYGAEFWVLQGLEDTAESKSDLEVKLNRNGGKIIHTVPRPAPDREHFCITRRTDFWDAEKAIRHGLQLVHPQWVHDSMEAGYRIGVTSPKYVVNTAQPTVENSISQYTSALAVVKKESDSEGGEDWADEQSDATTVAEDRWPNASTTEDGDSDHDLRDESPQLSQAKIEPSESVTDKPLNCEDVPLPNKPLDTKLEAEVKEGIFYPLVFYLDNKPIAHSSEGPVGNTVSVDPDGESSKLFSQVSRLLKAHGGRIVSDVNDPDSTHIICSPTDTSRCVDLRRIDKDRPRRRRLVTADWVLDSVEGDSCLYEADYLP
ncbi:DNA ligase (ATP) [Puccinia graminis f. sp. tritici]|uniref:DNA ligase (ATP) n=1 Tax=Puccinia graminis f. sp. tritici TaxID=56615 RepID=A0A5B0SI77_PUCGR|nr:DNA ligase (ATP) [Puccinia graminis f. sp. tritici]